MGMLAIKRPYIWLKRFRYRRGYGVHSPFAFDLITTVIYEKANYYSYKEIESSELYKNRRKHERYTTSKKLNRLLFRLANRLQPTQILQMGDTTITSLYLQKGCKRSKFTPRAETLDLNIQDVFNPALLYIPYSDNPEMIRQMLQKYIPKANYRSVCVVGGIGYSQEMNELWKELKECNSTGITFDLYDAGIIFFDKTRTKQHYIVNF